jgi:hypothetical protein
VEDLVQQGVAVKQFRAIQHAPDRIEVLIATSHPADPALERVRARLSMLLGGAVTVAMTPVDHIPVEPSGKLRRFVSLVDGRDAGAARMPATAGAREH